MLFRSRLGWECQVRAHGWGRRGGPKRKRVRVSAGCSFDNMAAQSLSRSLKRKGWEPRASARLEAFKNAGTLSCGGQV